MKNSIQAKQQWGHQSDISKRSKLNKTQGRAKRAAAAPASEEEAFGGTMDVGNCSHM
ncbi:hypothetical protein COLO4_37040 [Corchorus olitorius]|uniref:Uncharacterized protein n=1 Tax=Corchorus olitorius TaxID=93759 RepID=A0A1R3G3L9_9ROSI|nr:hypothetical protein COLO4_37040 [Corchorus olitorius]